MKVLWVKVDIEDGCEDNDGAVGIWEIELTKDLPPNIAAGATLDVFHEIVGIDDLENYEIVVLDPLYHNEIEVAVDYQQGTGCAGKLVVKLDLTFTLIRSEDFDR